MTESELELYFHRHIPLSEAMQVRVVSADPRRVIVRAPLAPNINHRETVFGGSASAVAILAAWSLLHLRVRGEGFASRVVIQRNTIEYTSPIDEEFTAEATLADIDQWPRFMQMLTTRGKGRIRVTAMLACRGQRVGHFIGDYVALGRERL